MPREARVASSIGVYHTILRGVNKQQIFECTEDYEHFVRILQRQCGLPVDTRPSNYNGLEITKTTSKPDCTIRKLIDVSKLHSLGWTHQVEIEDGVARLFEWYKDSLK